MKFNGTSSFGNIWDSLYPLGSIFSDSFLSDFKTKIKDGSVSVLNIQNPTWKDNCIHFNVAGFDKSGISVDFEDSMLNIEATGYSPIYGTNLKFSVSVPESIDPETLEMSCENGVLTITGTETQKSKGFKINFKD